ncbi:MAG: DUF3881 family protein, partial [Vallitaleaceae bacterium]|nr:DUF3881 family protein [Vallitaleaceae bacterium]
MMLYIKALGFSQYDTKEKAEELVNLVIDAPTNRYLTEGDHEEIKVEYYKSFGKDFGLVVRGEIDQKKELVIHTVLPYAKGRTLIDTHEVEVIANDERHSYSGFCEESKSGTPISFFLQNLVDYFDVDEERNVYINGIKLSLFAVEGTVILPIDKDEEDESIEIAEQMIREELLNQAREGNEEAIDALEEEAMEASRILKERLKSEDLLTILEGFFMPVGEDEDIYSVLGTIIEAKKLVNRYTKESVWRIKLRCMTLVLDVYINDIDFVGKASKGMRFKGTCWVHGIM